MGNSPRVLPSGKPGAVQGYIDGRSGISLNTNSDGTEVRLDMAGHLGLVVSEVVTNAYQHAFEWREKGRISVTIASNKQRRIEIIISDNGRGLPKDSPWPKEGGTGARIVKSLVSGLDGDINISTGESGTTVSINVPIT